MFNFFGGPGGFEEQFAEHQRAGGGRRRAAPQEKDDDPERKKFYDLLGVSKTATEAEIRKAYKKAAIKHHPDKGGDANTFQQISSAYEVLSDETKRQVYDEYGEKGLKEGRHEAQDMPDILSQMFGMRGGGGRKGPAKMRSTGVRLPVTLEQLYTGTTIKLKVKRRRKCTTCSGRGTNSGAQKKRCSGCDGQGVQVIYRPIGPGMVQQLQTDCRKCEGTGMFINKQDRCKSCSGDMIIVDNSELEFYVKPGSKNNDKVVLEGYGDEGVGGDLAGDIVGVLDMAEHSTFHRKGDDLLVERDITLREALCGVKFVITHLDGRSLVITSTRGQVIQPNSVMVVSEEGMPCSGNICLKGNLVFKFNVILPSEITDSQISSFQETLPAQEEDLVPDDSEECILSPFEKSNFGRSHARSEAYQEDDSDDEQGGDGVQCRQM